MKKLLYIVVGIAALFMIEEQARTTILGFRDPFVFTKGEVEQYQVKWGGTLNVIYEYDHIRFCETTLIRFIARKSDNAIMWRDRVPGGASGLGHQRVINPVVLPPEITPGVYIFRVYPSSQCRDGAHQVESPEVEFEVVSQ